VTLSCMSGIYPNPDKISWWRNDIKWDSPQVCDSTCKLL